MIRNLRPAAAPVMALAAVAALLIPASGGQNPQAPRSAVLAESVQPVATRATPLGRLAPTHPLTIVVSLGFAHPAEAAAYTAAVCDPSSPLYRQFLSPQEIGERFGASLAAQQAVAGYLQAAGMRIEDAPATRLCVIAAATAAQAESAFGVKLNRYREGEADRLRRGPNARARIFFANEGPVKLPSAIAPLVQAVHGLDDYVRVFPKLRRAARKANGPYVPKQVRTAYDTDPMYNGSSAHLRGQGRAIGLVQFEQTDTSDGLAYIQDFHLPTPKAGAQTNVHFVNVRGGATDPPSGEANLDEQMTLGMAPLANLYIYNSSYSYSHYLAVTTAIGSQNRVDLVSDSWGLTPSSRSQYQALNQAHQVLTMEGITYLNASGDAGSDLAGNGLYPETDPEVLAVGGTVATLDSANHLHREDGWHGSGGGWDKRPGYTLPAYQHGRGVPTTHNLRLVPDVSLHAAGVGDGGAYWFYLGGSKQGGYVGTSFASPVTVGCLAVVEEYLIKNGYLAPDAHGHYRLGRMQDALYAFNGRDDVFHDIRTGTSDPSSNFPNGLSCRQYWDAVTGWGSFDFYALAVALSTPLAVVPNETGPTVHAGQSLALSATVHGSINQEVTWSLVSGPGSIDASGNYAAPSSVTGTQTAVVRATSKIDTAAPVSGDVSITVEP